MARTLNGVYRYSGVASWKEGRAGEPVEEDVEETRAAEKNVSGNCVREGDILVVESAEADDGNRQNGQCVHQRVA